MRGKLLTVFILVVWALTGVCRASDSADELLVSASPAGMTAVRGNAALIREAELCSLTADAVRSALGAQIAVVNGGVFAGNLPGGEIRYSDARNVFYEDLPLALAEISPRTLAQLVEHGVSRQTLAEDESLDAGRSAFEGYIHVSGFYVTFDATAPAGERVMRLTLDDGTALDLSSDEPCLTLAATAFMLEGGYGFPAVSDAQAAELTLTGALAAHLRANADTLTAPALDRVTAAGTRFRITEKLPVWVILLMTVFFCACRPERLKKLFRREPVRETARPHDSPLH